MGAAANCVAISCGCGFWYAPGSRMIELQTREAYAGRQEVDMHEVPRLFVFPVACIAGLLSLTGTATSGGQLPGNAPVIGHTPMTEDAHWHEQILYSFPGGKRGAVPYERIYEDGVGNLFGTTVGDGKYADGTVFELAPSGSTYQETVLHQFRGGNDGANPYSSVVEDASGALYGTSDGGSTGGGIVFKVAGKHETVIHTFGSGSDGNNPDEHLILDGSGALYGATAQGGTTGNGVVFKLEPAQNGYKERVIYNFQGGTDASDPNTGVIADRSGTLYGTTWYGGAYGLGAVYKLTPEGSHYRETVLYSLNGRDGEIAGGPLAMDASGALYGVGSQGGYSAGLCDIGSLYGCGTVFKLTPAGKGYKAQTIFRFHGYDGANPSGVIIDSNGILYGGTGYGGHGWGTVFALIPEGNKYREKILWYFRGRHDGVQPSNGVIMDSTGTLYGDTAYGGAYGEGTVFKLSP